jgi:hypothetical protein
LNQLVLIVDLIILSMNTTGNKKSNLTILYTPWSNLKKDGSMETGQVTFHKQNLVKKVFIQERENAIINRLNKTKEEKHPDLQAEKVERQRQVRKMQRKQEKEQV